MAAKFAPGAQIYTDYKQLLKDPDVEAVSVCIAQSLPRRIAASRRRALESTSSSRSPWR